MMAFTKLNDQLVNKVERLFQKDSLDDQKNTDIKIIKTKQNNNTLNLNKNEHKDKINNL